MYGLDSGVSGAGGGGGMSGGNIMQIVQKIMGGMGGGSGAGGGSAAGGTSGGGIGPSEGSFGANNTPPPKFGGGRGAAPVSYSPIMRPRENANGDFWGPVVQRMIQQYLTQQRAGGIGAGGMASMRPANDMGV